MNIGRFFKNLYSLFKVDLQKDHKKTQTSVSLDYLNEILDNYKYEVIASIGKMCPPNIKTIDECVNKINKEKASLCRFGDGELNLCIGQNIPFQKASQKLSARLLEVLSSQKPEIMIAIPESYYSDRENTNKFNRHFSRNFSNKYDEIVRKHTSPEAVFYPAEMTLAYTKYIDYDFKSYFDKMISIWKNKDVTIICGQSVFNEIKHNIFDFAKSVEYQYAPASDAFEHYEEILEQARQIDKNRLVIIILGPTATVLAYDLALDGYQALDFGHIAKAYDWYLKEAKVSQLETAVKFFAPD